jgi:hypothetical protein
MNKQIERFIFDDLMYYGDLAAKDLLKTRLMESSSDTSNISEIDNIKLSNVEISNVIIENFIKNPMIQMNMINEPVNGDNLNESFMPPNLVSWMWGEKDYSEPIKLLRRNDVPDDPGMLQRLTDTLTTIKESIPTKKITSVALILSSLLGAYYIWKKYWKNNCSRLEGNEKIQCEVRLINDGIIKLQKDKFKCKNELNPTKCKEEMDMLIDKWKSQKEDLLSKLSK